MTNETMTPEDVKKLQVLFNLVCDKTDWKKPICKLVDVFHLSTMGATVDDVCRAVEFFTATPAEVVPVTYISTAGVSRVLEDEVVIRAAGYRAGPAF